MNVENKIIQYHWKCDAAYASVVVGTAGIRYCKETVVFRTDKTLNSGLNENAVNNTLIEILKFLSYSVKDALTSPFSSLPTAIVHSPV